MPDLLTELHLPEANRNKIRKKYAAPEVLIMDEWLTSEDILNEDISFLLDLMEDRSDCKSTMFCTLYPCAQWNDKLKRRVIGQSVIDRIVHSSVIIDCGTMNMRASKRRKWESISSSPRPRCFLAKRRGCIAKRVGAHVAKGWYSCGERFTVLDAILRFVNFDSFNFLFIRNWIRKNIHVCNKSCISMSEIIFCFSW